MFGGCRSSVVVEELDLLVETGGGSGSAGRQGEGKVAENEQLNSRGRLTIQPPPFHPQRRSRLSHHNVLLRPRTPLPPLRRRFDLFSDGLANDLSGSGCWNCSFRLRSSWASAGVEFEGGGAVGHEAGGARGGEDEAVE